MLLSCILVQLSKALKQLEEQIDEIFNKFEDRSNKSASRYRRSEGRKTRKVFVCEMPSHQSPNITTTCLQVMRNERAVGA